MVQNASSKREQVKGVPKGFVENIQPREDESEDLRSLTAVENFVM